MAKKRKQFKVSGNIGKKDFRFRAEISERKTNSSNNDIFLAFIATFLSIIGFIIAYITRKNDKYVMYYAKHSLIIFIIAVIIGAVAALLRYIPIIGWIIYTAVSILIFVMWVISWIYSLTGTERQIPVVSEWAEKINL